MDNLRARYRTGIFPNSAQSPARDRSRAAFAFPFDEKDVIPNVPDLP
jgi:hypothetical protein